MSPLLLRLGLVVLVGEALHETDRVLRLLCPRAVEQDGDKLIPASEQQRASAGPGPAQHDIDFRAFVCLFATLLLFTHLTVYLGGRVRACGVHVSVLNR